VAPSPAAAPEPINQRVANSARSAIRVSVCVRKHIVASLHCPPLRSVPPQRPKRCRAPPRVHGAPRTTRTPNDLSSVPAKRMPNCVSVSPVLHAKSSRRATVSDHLESTSPVLPAAGHRNHPRRAWPVSAQRIDTTNSLRHHDNGGPRFGAHYFFHMCTSASISAKTNLISRPPHSRPRYVRLLSHARKVYRFSLFSVSPSL